MHGCVVSVTTGPAGLLAREDDASSSKPANSRTHDFSHNFTAAGFCTARAEPWGPSTATKLSLPAECSRAQSTKSAEGCCWYVLHVASKIYQPRSSLLSVCVRDYRVHGCCVPICLRVWMDDADIDIWCVGLHSQRDPAAVLCHY
jgi:hypothetical protein